jgi:glycosyltransferase involved in cell wall biosynthesis
VFRGFNNFLTKGTELGMHILYIVAGLPPGGGIAESVPALCRHLLKQGHTVVLATVARADARLSDAAEQATEAGVRVVRFKPCSPHFLFFSLEMWLGLRRLARDADIVHVHSNWTFPVWWGCRCARRAGKKLVMSPQGCLSPMSLRHSAWKKRLVGWMDRYFLGRADAIHATSAVEREWVERWLGKQKAESGKLKKEGEWVPVVVIPNGVEAAAFAGIGDREAISRRWPECQGKRVALYLSRIHPIKGLRMLIDAWGEISHAGWQLLVVGADEAGHEAEIKVRVERCGLAESVTFGGPRYGEEKVAVMKAADLFILPSHSENFGIVVAEALACGVPVITTKGAPWSELLGHSDPVNSKRSTVNSEDVTGSQFTVYGSRLTDHGSRLTELAANGRCGWWIDVGVDPLARALEEAMELTDDERRAMGENGRRLVVERYTWERVVAEMEKLYCGH